MTTTEFPVFDGTTGQQTSTIEVEIEAPVPDPVKQLQAQVDALTDIVLGGAA